MSQITTHVLDTSLGRPGIGIQVCLERIEEGEAVLLDRGTTNADGRVMDLMIGASLELGTYQLRFDTGAYFASVRCQSSFYPEIAIRFEVRDRAAHYHVPLLLSPFGYSTYRGS